jgi:hypothetical protein
MPCCKAVGQVGLVVFVACTAECHTASQCDSQVLDVWLVNSSMCAWVRARALGCAGTHHHHHQITKLSHSINAIGPAPHRSGRKREHRSIVFATITHIPSLHKIRRNAPRYHPTYHPTGCAGTVWKVSAQVKLQHWNSRFNCMPQCDCHGVDGLWVF